MVLQRNICMNQHWWLFSIQYIWIWISNDLHIGHWRVCQDLGPRWIQKNIIENFILLNIYQKIFISCSFNSCVGLTLLYSLIIDQFDFKTFQKLKADEQSQNEFRKWLSAAYSMLEGYCFMNVEQLKIQLIKNWKIHFWVILIVRYNRFIEPCLTSHFPSEK